MNIEIDYTNPAIDMHMISIFNSDKTKWGWASIDHKGFSLYKDNDDCIGGFYEFCHYELSNFYVAEQHGVLDTDTITACINDAVQHYESVMDDVNK